MLHCRLGLRIWARCRNRPEISRSWPSSGAPRTAYEEPVTFLTCIGRSSQSRGLLPGIIDHGVMSFVVHELEEAARVVAYIQTSSGGWCW
jgi:hypothetical protein